MSPQGECPQLQCLQVLQAGHELELSRQDLLQLEHTYHDLPLTSTQRTRRAEARYQPCAHWSSRRADAYRERMAMAQSKNQYEKLHNCTE